MSLSHWGWEDFKSNFAILIQPTYAFRNIRLMLDEIQQSALKFAIFYIYTKTLSWFFHFSFHVTLLFPLMNALVYVDIHQNSAYIRGILKFQIDILSLLILPDVLAIIHILVISVWSIYSFFEFFKCCRKSSETIVSFIMNL